jgi:hypothetical protein
MTVEKAVPDFSFVKPEAAASVDRIGQLPGDGSLKSSELTSLWEFGTHQIERQGYARKSRFGE